ncbi:MAG: histidine phosphatase family protein [Ktedonobacterales bacterium]|nr:histidine phosphatase family protein [Ktedonobacterales bacterium]
MRLLLVRHGATVNNTEARFTGHSDVPLSQLGERQVERLAAALAGERFDALVTSDLRRARATATAIARGQVLPFVEDADLREITMGIWEGATLAEIEARDAALVARWRAAPMDFAPPGGETLAAFRTRLVRALERWRARQPTGSVLWVTHGGGIGVLVCHLLGMDQQCRWQLRRDNASITELEMAGDGLPRAVLVRLNETTHLRDLAHEDRAERYQVL